MILVVLLVSVALFLLWLAPVVALSRHPTGVPLIQQAHHLWYGWVGALHGLLTFVLATTRIERGLGTALIVVGLVLMCDDARGHLLQWLAYRRLVRGGVTPEIATLTVLGHEDSPIRAIGHLLRLY